MDNFMDEKAFLSGNKLNQLMRNLLKDSNELHVHFATYKECNSIYQNDIPGLTVTVTSGDMEPYSMFHLAGVLSNDSRINNIAVNEMETMGREAQSVVSGNIFRDLDTNDKPLMVVIYGGLTAFDEALDMAKDLKSKQPQAVVIMVTCDCEPQMKRRQMTPLLEDNTLSAVVETYMCGGRRTFRSIMEAVITQFPEIKK